MKKLNFFLIFVLFIVVTQILCISCKPWDDLFNHSSSNEMILNLPLNNSFESIDPANAYDLVSGNIVYQVYETLFEYHYLKRPYSLQPLLADGDPLIRNDGKTYLFKIKKNIEYHASPCFKGQKRFIKAQDFINELKRLAFKPTNSNGWWTFDGLIVGLNKFREAAGSDFNKLKSLSVEGLQAVDDYTLKIDLVEPVPQLPYLFAMAHTSPLPLEAIDCFNNDLSKVEVGTGPFTLREWKKDQFIKLERFSNYREVFYPSAGDRYANDKGLLKDSGKKIPFASGVIFHFYKDFNDRFEALKEGKIDLVDTIPKNEMNKIVDISGNLKPDLLSKKIELEISPSLIYWWFSFNMRDPVFGKNKYLRLAIAHAIDIDLYIRLFTNNIGQKANSILIPGIPGYDPRRQLNFSYNVEKAKMYFKEAKFLSKNKIPQITFDTRGDDISNRLSAEFIQQELSKIGLDVKIIYNTFPQFLEKARKGKMQFWQGGWALDYPDSINILQLLSKKSFPPGPNNSYYNNDKFEELFNSIRSMENGPLKNKLLGEIEDYVSEDLPWILTYYDRKYIIVNQRLKNYRYSDLVFNFLKYVHLD